ncbi:uncharacterized protein EI90DRAFT_3217894 [Cantharellus anzutake]|uniref:uncharacterized protein n=1 Tax=Cantharellus anzutake TaxID=1750568 RepID=UPI001906F78F|nr:uncharacterized protein EI90DRAFT_3217894 [Cantharellus anzutake]KAF8328100.1 hypothetical protein EI90DRAFT_3217894 [Cantharellus anzutake]
MRAFTTVVVTILFVSQALAAPGIAFISLPRDVDARNQGLSSRDEHNAVRRQPFIPFIPHNIPLLEVPLPVRRGGVFPSGPRLPPGAFSPLVRPPFLGRRYGPLFGYGPAKAPRPPLGRRLEPLAPELGPFHYPPGLSRVQGRNAEVSSRDEHVWEIARRESLKDNGISLPFLGYGPAMARLPPGRRFGLLGPGIEIRPDLFGPGIARPLLGRQIGPLGPGIVIPHFPPNMFGLGPARGPRVGREISEGELKRALSDQVLANGPAEHGLSGVFHHVFSRDLIDDLLSEEGVEQFPENNQNTTSPLVDCRV